MSFTLFSCLFVFFSLFFFYKGTYPYALFDRRKSDMKENRKEKNMTYDFFF